MKKRIKQYIDILFKGNKYIESKGHMGNAIVSIVLAFAASFMLVMNGIHHEYLMMKMSIVLVVGFFISFIVAYFFKNSKISGSIIGLLVAFVLSIFAISGGNAGFAILWILLVPIFAINLIGIYNGLLISTYFLIFIFVLFYSPLSELIVDKYNPQFISRFPILFLSDYLISCFLSLQKEFYYRTSHIKSYIDELTECYNRRYFMEQLENNNKNENNGIIVIDVNGLKILNDTKGHKVGDELIKSVPICVRKAFGKNIKICRIGGDEFAIITTESKKDTTKKITETQKYAKNYKSENLNGISFSLGYASLEEYNDLSLDELFIKADEIMYKNKNDYYAKLRAKKNK